MSFKLVSCSAILVLLISFSSSQDIPECACPRQLALVCGSDGQVYPNKCLLECVKDILKSDLQVTKEGPCDVPMPLKPRSGCACARNFTPVCGTDGVTYSNVCLLRCASLKNHNLEVQAPGSCGLKRSKRNMLYENRYKLHRHMPCSFE